MIIVTGGTGRLGSQIVDRLLERVPASRVGVSVRDADRAAGLAARGVRVRHGDYTDPASLATAFEGATQVLIVSADTIGEEALTRHRAAIDAAGVAGRILYTSHQGAADDSAFTPTADHAATERYLEKSGTPFTALRNGFYASTFEHLLPPALVTGELVAPADGPVSWTAHADLAEAAAVILTEYGAEGGLDGPTPPLTAPDTHDLADAAAIVSELTGRTVRRVVVDDDEWLAAMTGHGMPAAQAGMLLGMYRASRRGEFAVTDPTLEHLIGRPATTLRSVLESVLSSGVTPSARS